MTTDDPPTVRERSLLPAFGLGLAAVLMVLAVVLPRAMHWPVRSKLPPLRAHWDPRVGVGTMLAALVAGLVVIFGPAVARRLPWWGLLGATWATGVAWMLSLDLVDGWPGLQHLFHLSIEYFRSARSVDDLGAMLRGYVERIPLHSEHHWPVHLSAHPPGALLFFVLLFRVGVHSPVLVGFLLALIAASAPVGVLVTVRTLGAEAAARVAAPFLVLTPAALFWGLIGDGAYAAAAAWSLAAFARAMTSRGLGWGIVSGICLGGCLFLSYGFLLLAILALAVLVAARGAPRTGWTAAPSQVRFAVLATALLAAAGVVLIFAVAGFRWWDAYPVVSQRYWDGVASQRPASYWLWADLAGLSFAAGPLLLAGVTLTLGRVRTLVTDDAARAVTVLVVGAAATVVAADLSLMSKAEVERIWLPFMPWLLLGCALLPRHWRRPGLALQAVAALLMQNLLFLHF